MFYISSIEIIERNKLIELTSSGVVISPREIEQGFLEKFHVESINSVWIVQLCSLEIIRWFRNMRISSLIAYFSNTCTQRALTLPLVKTILNQLYLYKKNESRVFSQKKSWLFLLFDTLLLAPYAMEKSINLQFIGQLDQFHVSKTVKP